MGKQASTAAGVTDSRSTAGGRPAPPPFLAALDSGKGNFANAPKTRKRKAPEIGKEKVPADVGRGSPGTTSRVIVPASKQRPASASAPAGLSTSSLWEKGVSSELFNALRAPKHFTDLIPFTEAEITELGHVELGCLKAGSLVQSLSVVKRKAAKLAEELQSTKEGVEKTREELILAKNNYKKVNLELISLQQTHATNVSSLKSMKVEYEKQEKKLEDVKSKLEEAEADATNLRAQLASSIEASFNNTLDQIRLLNPGLEFNTTGMHFKAYVSDGRLISPSSPNEESFTQLDGDAVVEEGEEVPTAAVEGQVSAGANKE